MNITEKIDEIIGGLAAGENLDGTRELIHAAIGEKVLGALESRKQEIAANYFGQKKAE